MLKVAAIQVLAFSALISSQSFAGPNSLSDLFGKDAEAVQAFLSGKPAAGSVLLNQSIADQIRTTMGGDSYQAAVGPSISASAFKTDSVLDILREQQKAVENQSGVRAAVDLTKAGLSLSITSVATIATITTGPSGVGAFVGATGGFIANAINDAAFKRANEILDADAQRSARIVIAAKLKDLSEKDDKAYQGLWGAGWKDARSSFLRNNALLVDPNVWTKSDATTQAVIYGYALKATNDLLANEALRSDAFRKSTTADINALKGNVTAISTAFATYRAQTSRDIIGLQRAQSEILKDLSDINKRVEANKTNIRENKEDVTFLQNIMWGKMSASEQRQALSGKFFRDMPAADREKLEKKLDILERQEKIFQNTETILNGGQSILNLASKLGLDPGVVKTASTAMAVAQNLTKGIQGVASGNVFAVVDALSNTLGLFGGPDVATQRHEQIMQRFDQVLEGQKKIMEMQAALLEGQKAILATQRQILNAVVELSQQIQRNHVQVMQMLELVRSDILFNRFVIMELKNDDPKRCDRFLEARDDYGYVYSVNQANARFVGKDGYFPDFKAKKQHFEEYIGPFKACERAFEMVGFRNGEIDATYLARSYETTENQVGKLIDDTYVPTWNYTLKYSEQWKSADRLFTSLFYPATSVKESFLGDKWSDSALRNAFQPLRWPFSHADGAFQNIVGHSQKLLSVPAVLRTVSQLLKTRLYFELADRDRKTLLDLSELLDPRRVRPIKPYTLMNQVLQLVELAIAQQSVLAGESIFDRIETGLGLAQEGLKIPKTPGVSEYTGVFAMFNAPTTPQEPQLRFGQPGAILGIGFEKPKPVEVVSPTEGKPRCASGDGYLDSTCVLQGNRLLARNALVYLIRKQLQIRGKSYATLYLALEGDSNSAREIALGNWPIEHGSKADDKNLYLVLPVEKGGKVSLRLPSWSEVMEGEIVYLPELGELLQAKSALLAAIAEYNLPSNLRPESQRVLQHLLLVVKGTP